MLLRRLLALALAVGLVLGAMQVRDRLLGASAAAPEAADDLRIACAAELAAVCEALETSSPALVEQAGTTVQRFADPDLPFDIWLTIAPWPELAADARARSGHGELPAQPSAVLARSPVVIVAQRDRVEVMNETCGAAVSWRCLAEHADTPWPDLGGESTWGNVKVGLDHPAERAGGLLALAQATASYFEGASYNTRSLGDADFFAWLSDLAGAAGAESGQSPFERMLLTGSADYEFVGELEAIAVPLLARSPQRAEQLTILRPEPAVSADVVAVGYGDAAAAVEGFTEQVTPVLADNGWRVPGGEQPSELEPIALPDTNGVPTAATLETLRQTWAEVAR